MDEIEMAKISKYSILMEILSILFGIILIIIGSVMYSPSTDGAFFYIIVIGGGILAIVGLALFGLDMVRLRRKSAEEEDEDIIELEMAEDDESEE
jgi:hypothetical protein